MKRTLIASLLLVTLSAGGLGYLAFSALSSESLRMEQAIRRAEAKGLSPVGWQVQTLFEKMEQSFVTSVGSKQQVPSRKALKHAAARLPLVSAPYARSRGQLLLGNVGGKQKQSKLTQHTKFLNNKERIQYLQRSAQSYGQSNQQRLPQQQEMPRQEQRRQSSLPRQQIKQQQQDAQTAGDQAWGVRHAVPGNWVAGQYTFDKIVGDRNSVFIPRFLDNKLEILYWHRVEDSSAQKQHLSGYGFAIEMSQLRKQLAEIAAQHPSSPDLVLVLLDDKGQIVGTNDASIAPSGKPFISLELHPKLPHWTLAAYWKDPAKLQSMVRARRWTLGLVLGGCGVALLFGLLFLGIEVRRESQLALKQADFVSNVSHELKTPLTSIHMYAELMERRFGEQEKAREYSQIIQAECDRLTRLIGRVLDFSRSQQGKQEFRFAACDVGGLLRATVDEHALRYGPHEFTLTLRLPEQTVLATADEEALCQLVSNLISNARKYGSPENRQIEVALRADAERLVIGVRDHGAGVPRRWRRRIFDEFVRIDNSLAASTQGSGIGLALARRIARAHGGDLTVTDPQSGPGALFEFWMPRRTNA